MQYTRNDWRNRNLIKTPNGKQWLTIPVKVKGKYSQTINETEISDVNWKKKHLKTLLANYAKAKCFDEVYPLISGWYSECDFYNLSRINQYFIQHICNYLGINSLITSSSEYTVSGNSSEKLLQIVQQLSGNIYLSGTAAKNYMDERIFEKEKIQIRWMDYSNYPEYNQLFGSFEHGVSILDLIFNTGKEAQNYMQFSKSNHSNI